MRSPFASETVPALRATLNGRWSLVWAVAILLTASALFAWRQNQAGSVGGPISLPKVLWLNFALVALFVVPFYLWRKTSLAPATRRMFAWVLASFAARAPVELWMLYWTRLWRCEYGIAHDFLTICVIAFARRDISPPFAQRDAGALKIASVLQITLLVEAFMAWQFSRVASPAEGVYFASNAAQFHFVNLASWVAVMLGYPTLGYFLWRSGDGRATL